MVELLLSPGTSMATPHVAGAAAQVLSRGVSDADPVVAILLGDATPNVIQQPAGTANLLLILAHLFDLYMKSLVRTAIGLSGGCFYSVFALMLSVCLSGGLL